MKTDVILLRDALRMMDRLNHKGEPIPFSLSFVTANRRKDTGGKIKEIKGAILSKHNKALPQHVRTVDGFGGSKKPSHYENSTRNIQAPDSSITKVHIRLILTFNGQKIIW
jgi:hypothetical protein